MIEQENEVADFLAEQAMKDPNVRRIVQDARDYDELKKSPAWRKLYERIVADKEGFLDDLARRLMAGGKTTEEEIAFMRGFYQGAVWVVKHPAVAEKNLERAATTAWALLSQYEDNQEEDGLYGD